MAILNVAALESNKNFKISFNGGNLFSDGGLLLMKEFMHKFSITALLKKKFHTTDKSIIRKHKDADNFLQIIYQILGAYFADDTADALKNDPVFTSVLKRIPLPFSRHCPAFTIVLMRIQSISWTRSTE